jgi:hypothetical protein
MKAWRKTKNTPSERVGIRSDTDSQPRGISAFGRSGLSAQSGITVAGQRGIRTRLPPYSLQQNCRIAFGLSMFFMILQQKY